MSRARVEQRDELLVADLDVDLHRVFRADAGDGRKGDHWRVLAGYTWCCGSIILRIVGLLDEPQGRRGGRICDPGRRVHHNYSTSLVYGALPSPPA